MIERQTIVTMAVKGRYTSKPRPWVVVQSDDFGAIRSILVCAFTHIQTPGTPKLRIDVAPSESNGLRVLSQIQVEKIVAVHRTDLGQAIGRLEDHYMRKWEQAAKFILG